MDPTAPIPPNVPDAASLRSADIERAADLGKKRAQAEVALRQKIREKKEAEEILAHASSEATAEKKIEAKKKSKGFRSILKTREREYSEFEKRNNAEKEWYQKQEEMKKAHGAKEKAYMGQLREASAVSIAEKKRVDDLKAGEVREEQKIEFEYQEAVQQASREERFTHDRIMGDARQRSGNEDEVARQAMYKLETWKRSQLTLLDAEKSRLTASLQHLSPIDAGREIQRIVGQMRVRRRKIDTDAASKKQEIELQAQHAKLAIDREKTEALFQVGLDARRAVAHAERIRAQHLEEARYLLEKRLRDRSQGAKK